LSKDKVSKKIFSVKSITKFAQIIIQIIFFRVQYFHTSHYWNFNFIKDI